MPIDATITPPARYHTESINGRAPSCIGLTPPQAHSTHGMSVHCAATSVRIDSSPHRAGSRSSRAGSAVSRLRRPRARYSGQCCQTTAGLPAQRKHGVTVTADTLVKSPIPCQACGLQGISIIIAVGKRELIILVYISMCIQISLRTRFISISGKYHSIRLTF
jgi:hypothetical protein